MAAGASPHRYCEHRLARLLGCLEKARDDTAAQFAEAGPSPSPPEPGRGSPSHAAAGAATAEPAAAPASLEEQKLKRARAEAADRIARARAEALEVAEAAVTEALAQSVSCVHSVLRPLMASLWELLCPALPSASEANEMYAHEAAAALLGMIQDEVELVLFPSVLPRLLPLYAASQRNAQAASSARYVRPSTRSQMRSASARSSPRRLQLRRWRTRSGLSCPSRAQSSNACDVAERIMTRSVRTRIPTVID